MKKKSVIGQAFGILLTHILVSLMMFFILIGILNLTDNAIIRAVLSLISAVVYAFMIFSNAYECAVDDLKPYSTLKPYAAKGALLISVTVGVIIILGVLRIILWKVAPITDDTISPWTLAVNGLYLFMTSPFLDIVRIKGADSNIWGQLISVVVPVAACMFGYYCGYRKWDYMKYINRFVYEKKNKRK